MCSLIHHGTSPSDWLPVHCLTDWARSYLPSLPLSGAESSILFFPRSRAPAWQEAAETQCRAAGPVCSRAEPGPVPGLSATYTQWLLDCEPSYIHSHVTIYCDIFQETGEIWAEQGDDWSDI